MRILFFFFFLSSLELKAQNSQTNSIWGNFELNLNVGKGIKHRSAKHKPTIPGIVASNSLKQGNVLYELRLGYKIRKLRPFLGFEISNYKIKDGATILFIPGMEFDFQTHYPNFLVTPTLEIPYKKSYLQYCYLIGISYSINKGKFTSEPQVQIGILNLRPPNEKVFMKDYSSNYTKEVFFNGQLRSGLSYRLGVDLKYRISDFLNIQMCYQLAEIKPSISYLITEHDVFDKIVQREVSEHFRLQFHQVSGGISLNMGFLSNN